MDFGGLLARSAFPCVGNPSWSISRWVRRVLPRLSSSSFRSVLSGSRALGTCVTCMALGLEWMAMSRSMGASDQQDSARPRVSLREGPVAFVLPSRFRRLRMTSRRFNKTPLFARSPSGSVATRNNAVDFDEGIRACSTPERGSNTFVCCRVPW